MLVLTRTHNQSILIGDDVKVSVLGTHGPHVRFGIVAPADILVLRGGLCDRESEQENKPSPDNLNR